MTYWLLNAPVPRGRRPGRARRRARAPRTALAGGRARGGRAAARDRRLRQRAGRHRHRRLRRRAASAGCSSGVAPLEDFAYAIAAVVLLPSLWHLLAPGGDRSDDPRALRHQPPAQLGQHGVPVRGRVPRRDRAGRRDPRGRHALLPHPVQPRDVRHQRRLRLRVRRAQPAQGRRRGRAAATALAPGDARRIRRSRPAVRGRTSSRSGGPASWIVLAVSLFAVVAYSVKGLRFKERPFLDSITSSTHFVSPAVYALALVGCRADARRSSRCSSRTSCGARRRTPSARCRTSAPTARPASARSRP